jgi:putative transposase
MNLPKYSREEYIQFLIASPKNTTCTEASKCSPDDNHPAHDAINRLLARQPVDTEALWQESQHLIRKDRGVIVLDDSTLDKPYSQKTDLVSYNWSGKHHKTVKGVNLQTLLWSDGNKIIPTDFRLYNKSKDNKDKNQHFREMLDIAKERGFKPEYILFDSWYSASLDNLKHIRNLGFKFLTQVKSNRLVNPDNTKNIQVCEVNEISEEGKIVHLRGFGFVRLFRIVPKKGDTEYWITNDLEMTEIKRQILKIKAWGIESYHKGLKQCCNIEHFQVRKERKVRAHIQFSIRAFLRLEKYRLKSLISWFETKLAIFRDTIKKYLACPTYVLPATA